MIYDFLDQLTIKLSLLNIEKLIVMFIVSNFLLVINFKLETNKKIYYTTFYNENVSLYKFDGKHCSLLLPNKYIDKSIVQKILSTLDTGYILLTKMTGREPENDPNRSFDDLLSVAIVPNTCGKACGSIGKKGIEISEKSIIL